MFIKKICVIRKLYWVKNCGDDLHTTGTAMVPILSLEEPRNRYSECLFQGHGLLKYAVFC